MVSITPSHPPAPAPAPALRCAYDVFHNCEICAHIHLLAGVSSLLVADADYSATLFHTSSCSDFFYLAEQPWVSNITSVTVFLTELVTGIAALAGKLAARGFPVVFVSTLMPMQDSPWLAVCAGPSRPTLDDSEFVHPPS